MPDPAVTEFAATAACLALLAAEIRTRTSGGTGDDLTGVLAKVNALLDASIAADGFRIAEGSSGRLDLSKIDFAALAKRFKESKRKNVDLEALKSAVRSQLDKLIRFNKTRMDFLKKFEELIESYNSGSRSIEELFEALLALSQSLNEEEQRHVRENLTEAELTVFDILTRPGPDLAPEEREEVKKVARTLLERLRVVLVLDWRKRNDARAKVQDAIADTLDDGLPRAYTPALFHEKVRAVFEHTYESSVA